MDHIEARHPVTSLATVSCRTDLLDWYERRGYRQIEQMPLDQVAIKYCFKRIYISTCQNISV